MAEEYPAKTSGVTHSNFLLEESHHFVADEGFVKSPGAAWVAVFFGVFAGLLAAAFATVTGSGLLEILIWYTAIGGAFCAVSLIFSHVSFSKANEKLPVSRSTLALDLIKSEQTKNCSNQIIWAQRDPTVRAISNMRIFCVCDVQSASIGAQLADLVVQGGYGVDLCNCLETAMSTISAEPHRWNAIFIDIDECERQDDLDEIVSDLMAFRSTVPDISVVVSSASFARDNYGTERLSIADVSLRKPVSALKVLESMSVANENNRLWRSRLDELASGDSALSGSASQNVVNLRK